MIATFSGAGQSGSGEAVPFLELAENVNAKLLDAAFADGIDPDVRYVLYGRHEGVEHRVAVFCVANTIEPLGRRKVEQLRLAVPVLLTNDAPESLLGVPNGEDRFELTYAAKRGGIKSLLITPEVYQRRFLGRTKPPVIDLLGKLGTYRVIPMRAPDPSDA